MFLAQDPPLGSMPACENARKDRDGIAINQQAKSAPVAAMFHFATRDTP
jgi:hypothetical protein